MKCPCTVRSHCITNKEAHQHGVRKAQLHACLPAWYPCNAFRKVWLLSIFRNCKTRKKLEIEDGERISNVYHIKCQIKHVFTSPHLSFFQQTIAMLGILSIHLRNLYSYLWSASSKRRFLSFFFIYVYTDFREAWFFVFSAPTHLWARYGMVWQCLRGRQIEVSALSYVLRSGLILVTMNTHPLPS